MASIVISGDVSGSVTLSAPSAAGSTVLTLPTTSGTIVTTAGATSLTTSGNLTFTGTGNRIIGDFSNATVANRVAFQTSTTNGNTALVTIPNGTASFSGWQLCNNPDPTNAAYLQVGASSTVAGIVSGIFGSGSFLPIAMFTGASERLRIDTSGNVGIGTISPQGRLDVLGSIKVGAGTYPVPSNNLHVQAGNYGDTTRATLNLVGGVGNNNTQAGYAIQSWNTSDVGNPQPTFAISTLNWTGTAFSTVTERMRIDSSGNVNIGTTGAAVRLAVAGSNTADGPTRFLAYLNNTASPVAGVGTGIAFSTNVGSFPAVLTVIEGIKENSTTDNYASALKFSTRVNAADLAERMRITSDGKLILGTTTDFGANINTVILSAGGIGMTIQANVNGNWAHEFRNQSGTNVGTIVINSGGTAYNTTSDYRLKENIAPMTGALETVAQLKPVTYNWKVDGSAGQGFIAHELQAVVPDCVTGEKDAVDADGKPVYQGIDTSFLVATLTAAIQELKAELDEAKAEIAQLKGAK